MIDEEKFAMTFTFQNGLVKYFCFPINVSSYNEYT